MSDNEARFIQKTIEEVDLLLLEDKIALAAALLFDINKEQRDLWFRLKLALLKSADGHRELFLIASLTSVAERELLSQSFHLVPGLYALQRTNNENP